MGSTLRSRAASALAAVVLAPALLGATSASTSTVQLPAVDASHLRVVVETTSDWTSVSVTPGWIASRTPATTSDGIAATDDGAGWTLRGGDGQYQWMTADIVLAEVGDAPTFRIQTRKGWIGKTRVTVYDLDEGEVQRFQALNDVQSTTDSSNSAGWDVARADLLGTVPLALPKADTSKKVLAFYYPWFSTYDDPKILDAPSDPRSTFRTRDVASMTAQAAGAGVDGFVVSWRGEANASGLDLAVAAAADQGQVVSAYLETRNTGDGTTVTADGVYDALAALGTRITSPAWLRTDGVPVVFAYEMGLLPPSGWRTVHARLADAGMPLRVVGDAHSDLFDDVAYGNHHYASVKSPQELALYSRREAIEARADVVTGLRSRPELWAATVAPGFDDTLFRTPGTFVDREDGARYDATWDAAVASDPDFVLITSWNEWYETSHIEPSVLFGDLALRQTADRAAAWRGTTSEPDATKPKGKSTKTR